MSDPITSMANSVAKIAETASKTEQNMRFTLSLFGAAVAMQPGIDAKKLLADFDRQLEGNASHDEPVPIAAMDLRSTLLKVIEGLSSHR
jgi:hypothetical protein